MVGVLINVVLIVAGGLIGLFIGEKFSKILEEQIMDILGLCIIFIGISTSMQVENTVLMIISAVIGVAIGNALNLEGKFNSLGDKLMNFIYKNKDTGGSKFVEGFVSASLIFNVGSMAILGSITAGISGDNSILITKGILDGITAVVLAASFGIGVAFSCIFVFIYQGMIVLFSSFLKDIFIESLIANISGVGGILIIAIGFNMLKLKNLKTANMIPALFIPIVYQVVIGLFV
ncbi:putative membrane protein [Peptoniphilus sp. ING2-D1G]|nr:putative membrane protein [Peptoniphilus sp. ING2-D1G]